MAAGAAKQAPVSAKGRKAQPPGLKLLQGRAPGKDSGGRDIPELPEFTRAAPVKPADMSPDASALWDSLTEEMGKLDLLKAPDAASLEVACETYARWKAAVRMRQADIDAGGNGITARNSQGVTAAPWIGVEERASNQFRAWCAEFGITPASEKNLAGAAGLHGANGDDNPF